MTKDDNLFFEVSFEVGNKVGGIYTVISSKAEAMLEKYGDNYYAVGFYDRSKAQYEFVSRDAGRLRPIFDDLEKEGIRCYYGFWNIPGKPRCILIDVKDFMHKSNDIKTLLWEQYKIDSIDSDSWFEEPVVWSYAVGMLLERLKTDMKEPMIAQFHEWMSGVALLYLKMQNCDIATVFTVHATMLGRSIAGQGVNLAEMIDAGLRIKTAIGTDAAYEYKVPAKHLTEVVCARNCDVFTTVSKTTAKEAEFILGRKPDMILPNGLDMKNYPAMEKLSYRHKIEKDRVLSFLSAYFEPYYNVNLNDPRIIMISGRYEYHNKGLDVFIDALGQLNERLKQESYDKNTFIFIAIPSDVRGENIEILENFSLYNELENHVDEILPEMKWQLMQSLTHGEYTHESLLRYVKDQYTNNFKRLALAFKSRENKNPPLCALKLNYPEDGDNIISRLKHNNLFNQEDSPVKVIFYPAYLSSADRLLSMDYNSMLVASSLTVFPSYYEPWGYTPVESAANGCITITTDLAGFGQYISEQIDDKKDKGIKILKRRGRKYREIVSDLTEMMHDVTTMSEHEIIAQKHNAKQLSQLVGWDHLAENYFKAHDMALSKSKKRK
ncbi:MAG: glycogen/starch synthase [Candidatus Aenigmarchaeota archaeon]|nr:glycogen/starch synthase [Candidatus Aenigmarchaeota archaeon]